MRLTSRELLVVSLVAVVVLGFVAYKVKQKPSSVSATFDLTNGRSNLRDTPQILVSQQNGNRLLLQLDVSYYNQARFEVQFRTGEIKDACLNIGDSAGNDGWGGDLIQSGNNAELQIIGPSGGLLVYGNENLLTKAEEERKPTKSKLLKGEPALVKAGDTLQMEVTDGKVNWVVRSSNKLGEVISPHLFALNGQPDSKLGKPNDNTLFAAFNRTISNAQSKGDCVQQVKVTLSR